MRWCYLYNVDPYIGKVKMASFILKWPLSPDSIQRCIGNPIVEIRQSSDRLISTMGFPIQIECHLYVESGPKLSHNYLIIIIKFPISKCIYIYWNRACLVPSHYLYTNTDLLSTGPSRRTNFTKIGINTHRFLFHNMHLKMPSAKQQPFCSGVKMSRQHAINMTDQLCFCLVIF